jgi:tetratricopeptide (TPR) repeat protein
LTLQGKTEEARQAFEDSLRITPEFWPAVEELIDLDLKQDREPAAMERIKKQIDKNPAVPVPWLLKAKIHMANALLLVIKANRKAPNGSAELQLADVPSAAQDVTQAEAALVKAIDLNPDLPTGYQMLAKLYVMSNKQQQALARLNALVAKTNDVPALTQIGIIQEQLRDFPAARDAYERVLKVDPQAFEALNNLANLCAERFGQLDRAYDLANKAKRLQPNSPFAADTLGWIVYKRGDYPRALALIDESVRRLANDPGVQYHLGMTHYMLGEEQPARLALERASRSNKEFQGKDEAATCLALLQFDSKTATAETSKIIENRLREVPNDPIALQRLASVQERDGAFDKATRTYEMATKANPQNPELKLKLAQLYDERMNDSAKALELAKEAHKLAPEDEQVAHLLGRLAYRTKDYKWAASLLRDSARKLPDDPEVLYDLAWSYFSLGQLPEAQATMQKVSETAEPPSRREAAKQFLELTVASQDTNQIDQAADRAQKVLASAPDYGPALLVCAHAQEHRAKYKEAAELYNKILSQYPFFMPAARNLALLCFAHLADDQKAYDLATKARETFSEDAELAKVLGVLSYRRQDYSRSAQLLEQSARKRTDDAEVFYFLGMARYRLNQQTQSKEKLQRALALNVTADFADEAKRVLKEMK